MRLTKAICSLGLALLLTGCFGMSKPPVTAEIPARRDFTIPQQKQIAKECNAVPDGNIMQDVCADWERMRRGLK